MYKGSHSFKAPVIVALTVCYLTLLGYHHFTRPVQDQDVLVSGDFAREIPKELTRSKPVRQILEKTRAPLPGPESKFTFHPGSRPQLAQKHLGPKARYEYYQELATELGYQLDGLTVLGFRGISPDGKRHPSGEQLLSLRRHLRHFEPFHRYRHDSFRLHSRWTTHQYPLSRWGRADQARFLSSRSRRRVCSNGLLVGDSTVRRGTSPLLARCQRERICRFPGKTKRSHGH